MIRSLMQIALKGRAVIIGLAVALLLSGIIMWMLIHKNSTITIFRFPP